MNFNQGTFAVFFAAVLALHALNLPWKLRKFNLLVCSYLFYAAWSPPFVLLIVFSTVVDWFAAKRMYYAESDRTRRAWLLISLAANLGLLGYFKYGKFLYLNAVHVLNLLGVDFTPVDLKIVLPVGISFYTFQTLSYSIDAYRRTSKPWHSFLDYALYVTFFPQLVAGPIVRARDFLPQCIEPKRASLLQLSWGMSLIVLGLFEKMVLADGLLAPLTEKAFDVAMPETAQQAWAGVVSFAIQIFGDFAGYSTTAIGIAMCLGFTFQDNFHFPYGAVGFSDFWQRWHISLSSWLRDYLYIPLGGNRKGRVRTYVNLMITMLLGGLWHGAQWKFVAWGGLHGLFLIFERWAKMTIGDWAFWRNGLVRLMLSLGTFGGVCVTWVFFRSRDFDYAIEYLRTMFGVGSMSSTSSALNAELKPTEQMLIFGVACTTLVLHWRLRDTTIEEVAERAPWWVRATVLSCLIISIFTMSGNDRAFIYFQF